MNEWQKAGCDLAASNDGYWVRTLIEQACSLPKSELIGVAKVYWDLEARNGTPASAAGPK
ncbi:hypothetical protein [Sphingomonas sanguinis]|uniref:hypothetical protein n=1 Tax=Sphingomonas sanguinis TaxID=33051 RepID=UPI00128FB900|nr:hypothetical protein [Sphingomonas sanguinis]